MAQIRILLVEDDADDIQLLDEALKENGVDFHMDIVTDGDKVMTFLNNGSPSFDLIILDLNLPRVHGKDILKAIRDLPRFAETPVVIFSTSASPYDVQFAHDNGANRFITKPSTLKEFSQAIEVMKSLTIPAK